MNEIARNEQDRAGEAKTKAVKDDADAVLLSEPLDALVVVAQADEDSSEPQSANCQQVEEYERREQAKRLEMAPEKDAQDQGRGGNR